jgi:hypothetical protein
MFKNIGNTGNKVLIFQDDEKMLSTTELSDVQFSYRHSTCCPILSSTFEFDSSGCSYFIVVIDSLKILEN